MKTIAMLPVSLLLAGIASCQESRTVKVTVTEEDGTPIEEADATITFLGYSGETTQRRIGVTAIPQPEHEGAGTLILQGSDGGFGW
jgi:uncharacterized OsmC-like protein